MSMTFIGALRHAPRARKHARAKGVSLRRLWDSAILSHPPYPPAAHVEISAWAERFCTVRPSDATPPASSRQEPSAQAHTRLCNCGAAAKRVPVRQVAREKAVLGSDTTLRVGRSPRNPQRRDRFDQGPAAHCRPAVAPLEVPIASAVRAFTMCMGHFSWASYQLVPHVLTQAFSHVPWALPIRFRVARWRGADTARYKQGVS